MKNNKLIGLLIGILCSIIVTFLFSFNTLSTLNDLFYDQFFRIRLINPKIDNRIYLVPIDNESLSVLGDWPWKKARIQHAKVIKTLNEAGAKVIVLNFLLVNPVPDQDKEFIQALKLKKNVILPVHYDPSGLTEKFIEQDKNISKAVASLGGIANLPSNDGITRTISPIMKDENKSFWSIVIEIVKNFYNIRSEDIKIEKNSLKLGKINVPLDSEKKIRINYQGLVNTYPNISYHRVLNKKFPKHIFKDKIVLIGFTIAGGAFSVDFVQTPIDPKVPLPGIELYAQVISNILNNQNFLFLPEFINIIMIFLIGILSSIIYKHVKKVTLQVYWLIGISFTILLISFLMFNFNLMFNVVSLIIVTVIVFSGILIENVASTNLALRLKNIELTSYLKEIEELNLTLEKKVQERTKDLEQAYNKLEKLQKLKDDLTSMIVHDLKNPLTIIIGNIELAMLTAEEKNFENSDLLSLENAYQYSNQLLNMIQNILDINKMEESKLKLVIEEFSIKDFINKIVSDMIPLANKANKKLEIEEIPDIKIFADKNLISRVISNLVNNAIKHTKKQGYIKVSSIFDPDKKIIQINITDDGVGIPKEFHEKIFKKFEQLDAKAAGIRTGSGLGLTFCKMAVEAHNGKIWIESEVGKGSTFSFILPLNVKEPSKSLDVT